MSVEAMTMAELIRWDQLTRIAQLSRKAKVDQDEECRKLFKIKVEDLSVSGADQLIAHLELLLQEKKSA